jgi:hypothetical protein
MREPTGSLRVKENPKSPCQKPEIHFPYWANQDSPTPYCAFSAAICASVTSPPCDCSWEIFCDRALPGGAAMMAKLSTDTTASVTIM